MSTIFSIVIITFILIRSMGKKSRFKQQTINKSRKMNPITNHTSFNPCNYTNITKTIIL